MIGTQQAAASSGFRRLATTSLQQRSKLVQPRKARHRVATCRLGGPVSLHAVMPQVLSVQAQELVAVKFELQELRKEHVSLQVTLQEIHRRMSTTGDELASAQ